MIEPSRGKQLLILATTTGYQTRAFVEAAAGMGMGVVFGTDRCHALEDPWRDGALALRFEDPQGSAHQIVAYARSSPVDAIVALGDRPTPTAARAAQALGLPHHPPEAAEACRDKYQTRERLRAAGLNVPAFARFPLAADPRQLAASPAGGVAFPCVLKPLALSASRGVIRADDPEEFIRAFERIRALLRSPDVQVMREDTSEFIQVEDYIEGREIAVEGLVDRGQLRVLAIFDKPDPLVGPFFEETIYVTPSRLERDAQVNVIKTLGQATEALRLYHGPIHAELRIDSRRAWILEVAARPIGGLCSQALRFSSPDSGARLSLEEVVIRLALGESVQGIIREATASGVMMIPIPKAGIYEDVEGVEKALKTPGVEDIRITAKTGQKLLPLPEGSTYLGFIFARGESPEFVERALGCAHEKLRFRLCPLLPVI